jgi:hypothetical protein
MAGSQDFRPDPRNEQALIYLNGALLPRALHDFFRRRCPLRAENNVRAYFLTDDKSVNTLLAQMLPMTTSLILEIKAVEMVYKHGGYLVYKIPSAQPSNN